MGEVTKIEWADRSWSPWHGCMMVSTGEKGACENCYARSIDDLRFHKVKFGGPGLGVGTRLRTSEASWDKVLGWQRKLEREGRRETVFPSMCDPFDNAVPPEWRVDFINLMDLTPNLTWLLLTKRSQNIVSMVREAACVADSDPSEGLLPDNAAIGCTVVTQAEADRDIPNLLTAKRELSVPFAFASMEPLMGPINLRDLRRYNPRGAPWINALTGLVTRGDYLARSPSECCFNTRVRIPGELPALDWIIAGGESGPKARPSHPDWFRDLRDQCAAAGVPYLFKQWGEWLPCGQEPESAIRYGRDALVSLAGVDLYQVGKKVAGRLLDGVEHNGFPAALKVAA